MCSGMKPAPSRERKGGAGRTGDSIARLWACCGLDATPAMRGNGTSRVLAHRFPGLPVIRPIAFNSVPAACVSRAVVLLPTPPQQLLISGNSLTSTGAIRSSDALSGLFASRGAGPQPHFQTRSATTAALFPICIQAPNHRQVRGKTPIIATNHC